jgi:hypothetical protein
MVDLHVVTEGLGAVTCSDPMPNGGFETGDLSSWVFDAGSGYEGPEDVHSGSYSFKLFGTPSVRYSALHRDLAVPAGCADSANGCWLYFWMKSVGVGYGKNGYPYAYTDVNINDTGHNLYPINFGWMRGQFNAVDLAPYASTTMRTKFAADYPSGNAGSIELYVDDMQFFVPCASAYPVDRVITLKVYERDPFTGWSGACSGTDYTCAVPMNGAKTVTATFTP